MSHDVEQESTLETELLIPPKQAAERLGVSSSGLRRLAALWEEVYGPIRWEGEREGGGRVYPQSVISKLEAARALVRQGQSKSIQNALQALDGGATPLTQGLARSVMTDGDVMLALLNELQAMREELTQLRNDNAEMHRQLPPPEDSASLAGEVRALREQVSSLVAAQTPATPAPVSDGGGSEAGVLVRAASRLERLWARLSGQGRGP